jgi:hypothetical protein
MAQLQDCPLALEAQMQLEFPPVKMHDVTQLLEHPKNVRSQPYRYKKYLDEDGRYGTGEQ